jgi:1-acyl-sn-glycerol-3-phosphate acyltransferase
MNTTPDKSLQLPTVSRPLYRAFSWYGRRYLRRHFHAVRLSGSPPRIDAQPLLIYLNHPSWWDPMVCILLANTMFPDRTHVAPIDAAALGRYRFFERLGFFGIEPGTSRGAAMFLRMGRAILDSPGHALWVTAEGRFTDPRVRPVSLRPGVAHLAARLSRGVVLPLALEYGYWTERLPEALACFGEPIRVADHAGLDADGWRALLEGQLQHTMDRLADDAVARDPVRCPVLLGGRAGVSPVYDAWRRLTARLRGHRYDGEHLEVVRGHH